jgi:O-antigen/teichoic acid export membrane protein
VLAQIDKMVLSRLVPLETFGVYMLAWTVASGLSRVATPVVHAFSPRFTGLVSEGKTETLGKQLRIASQLTSVLILPSAALLVWVPDPILRAWIGNAGVAAEASPLLRVLTFGTVFSACSFPAASVLYSQKRLKPVIVVNSVAAVVLVPMLVIAVVRAGSMGAALCWSAYGLATYLAYQTLALMPLSGSGPVRSMVQDFVVPGLAALAVGGVVWTWSTAVTGTAGVIAMVAIGLVVGGIASLLVCRELRQLVAVTLGWQWLAPRLSA